MSSTRYIVSNVQLPASDKTKDVSINQTNTNAPQTVSLPDYEFDMRRPASAETRRANNAWKDTQEHEQKQRDRDVGYRNW